MQHMMMCNDVTAKSPMGWQSPSHWKLILSNDLGALKARYNSPVCLRGTSARSWLHIDDLDGLYWFYFPIT